MLGQCYDLFGRKLSRESLSNFFLDCTNTGFFLLNSWQQMSFNLPLSILQFPQAHFWATVISVLTAALPQQRWSMPSRPWFSQLSWDWRDSSPHLVCQKVRVGRNSKKPCQQLLCWLLLSQRKSDKGGVEILVHFALGELLAVWKWTKSTGWGQLAMAGNLPLINPWSPVGSWLLDTDTIVTTQSQEGSLLLFPS